MIEMSGEEYRQLSAELTKKQRKLDAEFAEQRASQKIAMRGDPAVVEAIARAYKGEHCTVRHSSSGAGEITPTLNGCGGDADVIIEAVHNSPLRAKCRAHACSAAEHATVAMRAQMDSGNYPTLEDHAERRTPAFVSSLDKAGNNVVTKLTKEEEARYAQRLP